MNDISSSEAAVMRDADARAAAYLQSIATRRVFPDQSALDGLDEFNEVLPDIGRSISETIALLDGSGSPATVATNGPRYFGFVVGAALPGPAAAERLMLAWDQGAPLYATSPVSAAIEEIAGRWLLDILRLPAESAVGFGTSATACSLTCLAAARQSLLLKAGWDAEANGLFGAPEIRVVVSEKVHITIVKALRILGFGIKHLVNAPVDEFGRIDIDQIPEIDNMTILCLQAGEVNTGEFDPFAALIPVAREKGAWVHVDGAFGLWARASARFSHLTEGIEGADSWTVDGHKWLNTPYDCAMAICLDGKALGRVMNSDAAYAPGLATAQKNLTLEFSRRARGIPVWAALRTLGRNGMAAMVDQHCGQAAYLARRLVEEDFRVVNRVVLNQIIVRGQNDPETAAILAGAQNSGEVWFGASSWGGRVVFRLSISSWRTTDADIDKLISVLIAARAEYRSFQAKV